MIQLEQRDGRYAINEINYASGIVVYTIEINGREMKAVAVLSEEDYETFHLCLVNMFAKGADPYINLHVDLVPRQKGYRFALIVGLGEPRS